MTEATTTEKPKRTPKPKTTDEKAKPKRRTAEERIADLQAEIERVREREAAKELRADPAVKLTAVAVRALNKALGEAEEPELVQALEAAKGDCGHGCGMDALIGQDIKAIRPSYPS